MYGNLQQADIGSLIQFIEAGQKSGLLLIESNFSARQEEKNYLLFFSLGRIIYGADNSSFNLTRIQQYLYFYKLESFLEEIKSDLSSGNGIPEYEYILSLYYRHLISVSQIQKIFKSLIAETIFNIFCLPAGSFSWQENYKLQPHLMSFNSQNLVLTAKQQIKLWDQYYPYINSPHQCPIIQNKPQLKANLAKNTYLSLARCMDGETSLLQLSRYLNRDLTLLAKTIYPCIQRGWIKLFSESNSENLPPKPLRVSPHIFCMAQEEEWIFKLRPLFKSTGCKFSVSTNLFQGLDRMLKILPDLILLELGNDLQDRLMVCRLMRMSPQTQHVPIISVANQHDCKDELKAKMAGVTRYVTKSLIAEQGLNIIKPYVLLPPDRQLN